MQNNNSKTNTVLLIILILLVSVCVWKLMENEKDVTDENNFQNSQQTVNTVKDKDDYSQNEITNPKPQNTKVEINSDTVLTWPEIIYAMNQCLIYSGGYADDNSLAHLTLSDGRKFTNFEEPYAGAFIKAINDKRQSGDACADNRPAMTQS
jgi:hypothetical protein